MILQPQKTIDVESSSGERHTVASLKADSLDQRLRPLADEGYNLGQSQYSSDNEDNEDMGVTTIERRDKMERTASNDSALGLDVDEAMEANHTVVPSTPQEQKQQQQRRMTLTVTDLPLRAALLPLAEPSSLSDSSTSDIIQSPVSSKLLLEERVVEISDDPRGTIASLGAGSQLPSSRRESELSCSSDYPNSECSGVRYVRTPSVVVSDYSDDVMCGITVEEMEYFRAQRMCRHRSSLETSGTEKDGELHSDISAALSCSNLHNFGSAISECDGVECSVNAVGKPLEQTTVDGLSPTEGTDAVENMYTISEQSDQSKDLADLLATQHLNSKRSKRVNLKVPFQLKIETVD